MLAVPPTQRRRLPSVGGASPASAPRLTLSLSPPRSFQGTVAFGYRDTFEDMSLYVQICKGIGPFWGHIQGLAKMFFLGCVITLCAQWGITQPRKKLFCRALYMSLLFQSHPSRLSCAVTLSGVFHHKRHTGWLICLRTSFC